MDVKALPKDERERLARDPETDPDVLTKLAGDFYLLPDLITNPATPTDVLRGIYRDFPHPRPDDPDAEPDDEVDAAIAAFKRRQSAASRSYPRSAPRTSTAGQHYVQVLDANGRAVQVPVSALGGRGTNALAIASFVLSVVGGSVLAVILGHVARSQIAETGESGDGLAAAALAIGYVSIAIFVLLLIL